MSVIGMILMWVWFFIVFAILSKWHMGEEYDHRRKHWAKYESK